MQRLNLYIGGVKLDKDLRINLNCRELINEFCTTVPKMVARAKQHQGSDVIMLIALQEYAFTRWAISKEDKDYCLALLQKTVDQHDNLILVPGSFAYMGPTKLKDEHSPKKIKKLTEQYEANPIKEDRQYQIEHLHLQDILKKPSRFRIFQNALYLLSKGTKKIKHQKSAPFNERNRIKGTIKQRSVYMIGADHPIKNVTLANGLQVSIGISICREHLFDNKYTNQAIKSSKPDIHIIVSDTVQPDYNHFYGTVTVYLDSVKDFEVINNDDGAKKFNVMKDFCTMRQPTPVSQASQLASQATLFPTVNKADSAPVSRKRKLVSDNTPNKRHKQGCTSH